jgi:predicted transcriptional regulator
MFTPLTKAEEKIMQALWKLKKGSTHDIIDALPNPKPHYNTVSTILKILLDKGFVKAESIGKSNCYSPNMEKDVYRKYSMKQYVSKYFSGSYTAMISFFAKEKNISIKELESILEELKQSK